jgi:catechol-2,3-dioxygenase
MLRKEGLLIPIRRLNHAVLFVADLERSLAFYRDVFGFRFIAREGRMAFLRAEKSENHHDLGLLEVGGKAPKSPKGSIGLYHLAWELSDVKELAAAREVLIKAGAFTGESDHGATKSVYGADPDGNEFELMVLLPKGKWGRYASSAPVMPLDWDKELG